MGHSSKGPTPFIYRPEVDGLRALAVLAVVFFHVQLGCPGGYVGVDVFFVISGFLITSLIWRDLQLGRFAFGQFWERRARRIAPALVVVTVVTVVAGWGLLLPEDFASLCKAAASQAVFGANFHYWNESGYFQGAAEEKPLLHTWSLAVEEQFYLFMPILLWALVRWKLGRGRAVVLSVLGAGLAGSLLLSVVGVGRWPHATFYLLPTRAWELLVGAILAFAPPLRIRRFGGAVQEALSILGLALILYPVFGYSPETRFPGLAAVPPCLGTALLIWANSRTGESVPTVVGKILAKPPVVFIGLISYSLYLWHWPFIAFSNYLALEPSRAGTKLILLLGGFLCAVLSWRWVETPFRKRTLAPTRVGMYAYAGSGLALVMIIGMIGVAKEGFPGRVTPEARALVKAEIVDRTYLNETLIAEVRAGKGLHIGVDRPSLSPSLLVWGDSHAMAALPAVDTLLKERGLTGRAMTRSSTAPVCDWYAESRYGLNERSIEFNEEILSYIHEEEIPVVVLIALWSDYVEDGGSEFENALVRTVHRIAEAGAVPYLLLGVPVHPFEVPRALASASMLDRDLSKYCASPSVENEYDGIQERSLERIRAAGTVVIDPKPAFLDSESGVYMLRENGVVLYRDAHHLTTDGAIEKLKPVLAENLDLDHAVTCREECEAGFEDENNRSTRRPSE